MSLGKRLLQGGAIYAAASLAAKGIGLLLVPILATYLEPHHFGELAIAESFGMVMATVFAFGLPVAYSRLAFEDEVESIRTTVAGLMIGFGITGLCLSFLVGDHILVAFNVSAVFWPLVGLACIRGLGEQFNQLFGRDFQVRKEERKFAIATTLTTLVIAALSLAFVIGIEANAVQIMSARVIGTGLAFAGLGFILWRRFKPRIPSWEQTRNIMVFALPLLPYQLSVLLLEVSDRFLLEYHLPTSDVGLYYIGYSLGLVMQTANAAAYAAWYPRFYELTMSDENLERVGRLSAHLLLSLGIVAGIGVLIAQDFVVVAFPESYTTAWPVVPIIIVGYFFHGLFSFFHLSILKGKHSNVLAVATGLVLAVNFGLNLVLIPIWGIVGAAIATMLAYFVEAVLIFVLGQRRFPVPYPPVLIFGSLAVWLAALVVVATTLSYDMHLRMVIRGIVIFVMLLALGSVGLSLKRVK